MNDALQLEAVGKSYRKGEGSPTLFAAAARGFRRRSNDATWALRHLSFEVEQGSTLGIIGRNGAGKTTLLKLLSGVTSPTEGTLSIRGRVAPLIGVGVGFHAELTGRENVFVNGQLLGLSKAQIVKSFDAIVEFSEISAYLDVPVKTYSSGMFLRLAFAVAVHAEPDIFLLDEVLAVGDMAFQLKCNEKMREIQSGGATIVLVTHSMEVLARLTPRAVLLHRGRLIFDGLVEDAVTAYHLALRSDQEAAPGSRGSSSVSCDIVSSEGLATRHFVTGDAIRVRLTAEFHREVRAPAFWLGIASSSGELIYTIHSPDGEYAGLHGPDRPFQADIALTLRLLTGDYTVRVNVFEVGGEVIAESLSVAFSVTTLVGGPRGIVDLEANLSVGGQELELPVAHRLQSPNL